MPIEMNIRIRNTNRQAKKREQVSERIANKLKSETTLHHQIVESERELKSLRIATDSAEFNIKYKDVAVSETSSCRMQRPNLEGRCVSRVLMAR